MWTTMHQNKLVQLVLAVKNKIGYIVSPSTDDGLVLDPLQLRSLDRGSKQGQID